LNGMRYTEADWATELSRPNACSIVTRYEDRFGLLGRIAVLLGHIEGRTLRLRTWVMSCRAFGRRIEYLCLKACFERYGVRSIEFDFKKTVKNGPLQEFLALISGQPSDVATKVTRERFEQICPALYHVVKDSGSPTVHG
jgi:predicted enzyme involved in methoxymalonyl-ACP biosynthesis